LADETRQLAEFAAGFTYEQIPADVRTRAVDILIDQLGVEIGCSQLPWAKQVREVYRQIGGVPEATVVRYGDRLPIASAAFINSTFGHSFEYDDANPLIHGHPGAELVPSLMAIAEREHCSGREFLTTFVASYEVRGRIGWAVSPDLLDQGGPQYSTTCGPFGVAAGAARLLGLGADGIRNALGIAGCYSGGLMQYDHGGGSAKRIFAAIPARSGVEAALLTQAGMTGPEGILEGKRGLLRIYPTQFRPERLTAELGTKWTILHVLFKGGAQAYPEVMAGRVDLQLDPTFGIYRYVKAGKMKGIAVTSAKRDPSAPEVPAVAETLPGFEVLSINGIIVPRATPRDLVLRLNADFRKVLQMPDISKRMVELGLEPVGNSPEEFDAFIRSELERWGKVAKAANIHLD